MLDTTRREFIALIGGGCLLLAVKVKRAWGQQPAMPVIGFLNMGAAGPFAHLLAVFNEGLGRAGYVDGKSVALEYRWAEGRYDRLPALAAELVHRQVSVLIASGGNAPAQAAKAATDTIPIVFVSGGEPVRGGLVTSINRPGANITGVSTMFSALAPKRLDLLSQLVRKNAVLGALINPNYPDADLQRQELDEASAAMGRQLRVLEARNEVEIEAAFARFAGQVDALIALNDPFFDSRRDQVTALAAHYVLPTIYSGREFAVAGGLISYGPSLTDAFRLAGIYAGRILKGEKPADLPVQQSTKFEFVINVKTAKALGLEIPDKLLALADEVIE
jgi:putative ABC transport system substrate-binding protein